MYHVCTHAYTNINLSVYAHAYVKGPKKEASIYVKRRIKEPYIYIHIYMKRDLEKTKIYMEPAIFENAPVVQVICKRTCSLRKR